MNGQAGFVQEILQHIYEDLLANHLDEHRQPGHQLHQWRRQVQHDNHLHGGASLGLPGRVRQPPQHRQHKAGGSS